MVSADSELVWNWECSTGQVSLIHVDVVAWG